MTHQGFEVGGDAASHEDDLLAAPAYGAADEAVDDELDSDGGFSDSERIVRVWVEDGRLVKNRISPVWYTRLGQGGALGDHFREALMLALLDRAARDRETAEADGAAPAGPMAELVALPDEVRAAFEAIGPLSDELIDAVSDAQDELDERLDVAFDAAERVAPRAFTGRSKGVTVTLDSIGNTVGVDFDEKWLDDVQVGPLIGHVQLAADRAQAAFEPPPTDQHLQGLLAERRLLSNVLTAILNPRSE